MADRPLGVTIICILGFLGAILTIITGAIVLVLGGIYTSIGLIASFGVLNLVIGTLLLLSFYWVWNLEKKGWTIVMILEAIGIITSLLTFNIIGVALPLVVIIYLYTKKDIFT